MGNSRSAPPAQSFAVAPDRLAAWIQDRQLSIHDYSVDPRTGVVTNLYQTCLQAGSLRVQTLRQSGKFPKTQFCKLTTSLSRLHAWGEDLCEGQLDFCVIKSSALRMSILEQLVDLGRALLKGKQFCK